MASRKLSSVWCWAVASLLRMQAFAVLHLGPCWHRVEVWAGVSEEEGHRGGRGAPGVFGGSGSCPRHPHRSQSARGVGGAARSWFLRPRVRMELLGGLSGWQVPQEGTPEKAVAGG